VTWRGPAHARLSVLAVTSDLACGCRAGLYLEAVTEQQGHDAAHVRLNLSAWTVVPSPITSRAAEKVLAEWAES
jgi:hypothetical protein